MTRFTPLLGAALVALVLAAPAAPTSGTTVTIRHQVRGCHAWSVNNGPFKASRSVSIKRGAAITFVDNDVMPHRLVKTAGPALKLPASASMKKMGASTRIVFSKAGKYTFTTKFGEDYPGIHAAETVGEDATLKLTVTVR